MGVGLKEGEKINIEIDEETCLFIVIFHFIHANSLAIVNRAG